jgi:hypothetical protein
VEKTKVSLNTNVHFRTWLANRSVWCSGVSQREFSLGGSRVGDTYISAFKDANTETVLASIARCVIANGHLPWANRFVVVGYRDGDSMGGVALNLAAALSPPVEHMTPEEFVERALAGEFGETPPEAEAGGGEGD